MRPLSPDRAVSEQAEDVLDRQPFAGLLATEVLATPADAGFVMGLTGAWGTGKTTVLHFVEREIGDRATVLWFNPWLFSGAEQLVALFFAEIAGQLRTGHGRRLKRLGKSLAAYGEVVAPAAGVVLGPAAQTLALPNRVAKLKEQSARDRHRRLAEELAESGKKLVVFVDDFDRLRKDEVREVVRLVKLVADLPNVVYVLAYDQPRVERALSDGVESGRAYLDKIVQAPHALPTVSRPRLQHVALNELEAALGERELHYFDRDQWSVLAAALLPFVTTIRAAKRYANVAPSALDLADVEVAAHDVLALTALRVFEPEVHTGLARVQVELTGEAVELDIRDRAVIRAERKARLDDVLSHASDRDTTERLLRALFPAAPLEGSGHEGGGRRSRAAHRVASRSVLAAYLHASLDPSQIATAQLDRLLDALGDPAELRVLLHQVEPAQLRDMLDRIRDHPERFPTDGSPDRAAAEFLRIESRVPGRDGFFDVDGGTIIAWVVEDLIARLSGREARTAAIQRLFEGAENLSQRWRVLSAFGTWPDQDRTRRTEDDPTLDEPTTAELERMLAEQVRRARPDQLADEAMLLSLLRVLNHNDESAAGVLLRDGATNDRLFLAVAVACVRRIASSSPPFRRVEMDTEAVYRLLGDDDAVSRRAREIQAAGAQLSEREAEALELLVADGSTAA
jgi:hypothetical protein